MSEVLSNGESNNPIPETGLDWDSLTALADKMDDKEQAKEVLSLQELEEKYGSKEQPFDYCERAFYAKNPQLLQHFLELGAEHEVNFRPLINDVAYRVMAEGGRLSRITDNEFDDREDWRVGPRGEVLERFSDDTLIGLGKMYSSVRGLADTSLDDDGFFVFDRSENEMTKVLDSFQMMSGILQKPEHPESLNYQILMHENLSSAWLAGILKNIDLANTNQDTLQKLTEKVHNSINTETMHPTPAYMASREILSITINTARAGASLENALHYTEEIEEIYQKDLPIMSERESKLLRNVYEKRGIIPEDMKYLKEKVFPALEEYSVEDGVWLSTMFSSGLKAWREYNPDENSQAELAQTAEQDYAYTDILMNDIIPKLTDLGVLTKPDPNAIFPTRIEAVRKTSKFNLLDDLASMSFHGVSDYNTVVSNSLDIEGLKWIFDAGIEKVFPLIDKCETSIGANAVVTTIVNSTSTLLDPAHPEKVDALAEIIEEYTIPALNHLSPTSKFKTNLLKYAGTDRKFLDYLVNDLFPKMDEDPEYYTKMNNLGLGLRGGNQVRNFEIGCMVSTVTPYHVNLLMNERNNLAVSSLDKLSQNRIDALAIERTVIDDHSFIHDQLPMTHRILQCMVNYYDAQGTENFQMAEKELNDVIAQTVGVQQGRGYGNLARRAFNLETYDEKIVGEVADDRHKEYYDEKVIDILRRLAENTDSSKIDLPDIKDPELKELVEQAKPRYNMENDTLEVDWNSAGRLINRLNVQLISSQGEFGLDSQFIESLNLGNRIATYAMRSVPEQYRRELPFDPVFKEFVRFQELTASFDGYDHDKFERFYEHFCDFNYDDSYEIKEHFVILQQHILSQTNKLARQYNRTTIPSFSSAPAQSASRFVMQLLSGNLGHELIRLTDPIDRQNNLRARVDRQLESIGAI